MKLLLSICFVAALFLTSCFRSDNFSLNKYSLSEKSIYGLRINGSKVSEKLNENSIVILDTGIVALAYAEVTEFEMDFGVVFKRNPKFDILLRTTPQDYIDGLKNVKLEFDSQANELRLFDSGKFIKSINYKFTEELKRIRISNISKKIKVFIDCDDIIDYKTELALTEYIIFRNNKIDSLEVNAVSVTKI